MNEYIGAPNAFNNQGKRYKDVTDNKYGEVGRCIISTMMMQLFAAMVTLFGDLEIIPKQFT